MFENDPGIQASLAPQGTHNLETFVGKICDSHHGQRRARTDALAPQRTHNLQTSAGESATAMMGSEEHGPMHLPHNGLTIYRPLRENLRQPS